MAGRRVNWGNVSSSIKLLKRNVKNVQAASEYLAAIPGEGEFYNTRTKKSEKIVDAKTSTLRQQARQLNTLSFSVTSEADRHKIIQKIVEIQNELDQRDDAIISAASEKEM